MSEEVYSLNTKRAEQARRISALTTKLNHAVAKLERLEKRLARYKRVLDHHGIDPRQPLEVSDE